MTTSAQPTRTETPPSAESVALARLLERHRREYDFYLERAKAGNVQDPKDLPAFPKELVGFSLAEYIQAAMELAEYSREEDGMILAIVPGAVGFFTEGETYEKARANLKDAIEGCIMIDLQMGWPIHPIPNVDIEVDEISSPPVARGHTPLSGARIRGAAG